MRCSSAAIARCVCVLGVVSFLAPARAQTTLWMQFREPANGIINPGGLVVIDVYVDGIASPTLMRTYQNSFEIVPQPGAAGSLIFPEYDDIPPELIPDNVQPPNPPDPFYPWWVDLSRPDWAFFESGVVLWVAGWEESFGGYPKVGATGLFPSDWVEVLSPKYLSTYVLQASPDAAGDFDIDFLLVIPEADPPVFPSFFQEQGQGLIEFTVSGEVTVSVVERAPNDACADAQPVTEGVVSFTTLNSTTDGPALPSPACNEGTGNGVSFEKDVWFEYVAGCTGIVTISTCDGSTLDTRLAVYGTGAATCSCPTDNTSFLDCSDDALGCGSGTSEIALSATQGECFTIRLGAPFGAEGTGSLTITCAPDMCQDASPLAVGSSIVGSTENTALNDNLGDVDCGTGLVDSPGVWYAVTGTGRLMTASLCNGASYDTRLTVYEGGCAGLSCVADANDTCSGSGSVEFVRWCSTPGVEYLILVHGAGGASGTFSLQVTDQNCDDGNACTDNSCVDILGDLANGACTSAPNYNVGVECCDPADASTTTIDDGNPCTDDECNAATGVVTHPAVDNGQNDACDDSFSCTIDECIQGSCENNNINDQAIACSNDGACQLVLVDSICCTVGNEDCMAVVNIGECFCDARPTLALVPQAGGAPIQGCYLPGETAWVYVEMGFAETPVVGAQFFVEYDSTTLLFERVEPGVVVEPGSPFAMEFNETVNPILGTIDYVIGVNFGSAAQEATTVAAIEFTVLAECDAFLRFRPSGPGGQPNTFTAVGGLAVEAKLVESDPLSIRAAGPTLTGCPSNITTSPDPGGFTATVGWVSPLASDNCDIGIVKVNCSPGNGSEFQAGTTTVTCIAINSCGLTDFCTFDVTVEPSAVTVDLQLSPTMVVGPVDRCITFELWDCDGPSGAQHVSMSQGVSFLSGQALGVNVPIPGGAWECIGARDGLHSLRSTAPDLSTVDGVNYTASFVGDRSAGGHWLAGGNLNDDQYIDILDFGVFFPLFLTQASQHSPCGTASPHANINGDGVVDLLDLIFLSGNSLLSSEPICCGGGVATSDAGPVTSITVRELHNRGLGHMAVADVNRDGVLDMDDLTAFMQGDLPPSGDSGSLRESPNEKPGRGSRGYRPGR